MNKIFLIFYVSILLISFNNVHANDKIAVINLYKVFYNSPKRAAISKQLENEFNRKIVELQSMEHKLNKKIKFFQINESTMTLKDKKNLEKFLLEKKEIFYQKLRLFEKNNHLRQLEERNNILHKIKIVTKKIALKEGYDVVLSSDNVIFMKKNKDITEKVLKKVG